MNKRHRIRDDQWERIKDMLPGKLGDPGRTARDNRGFIDAVMWIVRTGAPWRDLPPERGKWTTVHKRFMRWTMKGIWQKIFDKLTKDADKEWLMIDSTIARVHQHASGGKGGLKNQGLGQSRGGLSTKIHALSDALGNPMRFIVTGGEVSDYKEALRLLEGQKAAFVLGDKGYDADYIINKVKTNGCEAVIPPRSNRKSQRKYDKILYKERNKIERMFGKLKQFRRVATRYDKLRRSYLSFVLIASIHILLQ